MISQSMDLTKNNLAASLVEVNLAWTGEEQINENVRGIKLLGKPK